MDQKIIYPRTRIMLRINALRHTLMASLLVFPLFACSDYPSQYSAEAIEAQVIDAQTKKPLAGVIVTANWQLVGGTVGGAIPLGQLEVLETVTDKNGRFAFPSWGPKKAKQGFLRNRDPQLLLFRSGYRYRVLTNPVRSEINKNPVRTSQWNGKSIELRRVDETPAARLRELIDISKEIRFFGISGKQPCEWMHAKGAIKIINEERVTLEKLGHLTGADRTIDQGLIDGKTEFIRACGKDAESIIGALLK